MTKADFMKDAKANRISLMLTGGDNYDWIKEKRPQNLKPRSITKVQTNAIYLYGEENGGRGSFLQLPPASLMEYTGDALLIFNPGVRDMTQEEKDNVKRAEIELKRYEEENPYSEPYWHMKDFYSKCTTPWIYSGSGEIKGKRAGQGSLTGKIIDNAIKGKLILQYKVIKEN